MLRAAAWRRSRAVTRRSPARPRGSAGEGEGAGGARRVQPSSAAMAYSAGKARSYKVNIPNENIVKEVKYTTGHK